MLNTYASLLKNTKIPNHFVSLLASKKRKIIVPIASQEMHMPRELMRAPTISCISAPPSPHCPIPTHKANHIVVPKVILSLIVCH